MPLQEALASSRFVGAHEPDLQSRLRAVLDRRRTADAGVSRPYEQGFVSSAFELHAFNSDGLQKRSQVSVCPSMHATPTCCASHSSFHEGTV